MTRLIPRMTAVIATLATALAAPAGPAAAQDAPDPHVWTCADLLGSAGPEDVTRSNMTLSWALGYMYGRFGSVEGANMTAERYQQNLAELVGVFRQVCPNVPELTVAEFTRNLADDFANSLSAAE